MAKETPLVKQYQNIKSQYPDTLLFFRLGDFYELFGDDAIEASKLMEVTLTKRQDMPLCGVPYHSATKYIKKLLNKSKSVAICEQVEDPSKAKGIVKREVVRVITPGTIIEDDLLTEDSNNFLVALAKGKDGYGIAMADISTGDFMGCLAEDFQRIESEFSRLPVKEAVIPDDHAEFEDFLKTRFPAVAVSRKDGWYFTAQRAEDTVKDYFEVNTLKGWELDRSPAVTSACGGLIEYLSETQKGQKIRLKNFKLYTIDSNMILDRNTQENLELIRNLQDGRKKNTLFDVLDFTDTAMGKRRLTNWILRPLKDKDGIVKRHNGVEELVNNPEISKDVSDLLKLVSDMERILSKTAFGSCNARDLLALRESLKVIPQLKNLIKGLKSDMIAGIAGKLEPLEELVGELETAIVDSPPLAVKEGKIIKRGYSEELDKFMDITSGDKKWVADLEKQERKRLSIPSLKVGYNRVHGYYIEVTKTHSSKVPVDYQRKQTLVNSERYITEELKQREDSILGAEEKRAALEYSIFCDLRNLVICSSSSIQRNAELISIIDVINSFSTAARKYSYTKPHIGEWDEIVIRNGRHPVVEKNMGVNQFIPNDTVLDKEKDQIMIITGPNMSGKSTYLKQVAIITVMAQMGSYVPAAEARIGMTDRIFTRIGASENLAGGESTFMVEMTEVATILNNATSESLLIMDEVGRGTSTFDGISIAWAVIEEIAALKARTLFATHYFELTELSAYIEKVKNYNFAVREWKDRKKVVFLRKLQEGSADKSYGIHCAQLAGVPRKVIDRAWDVFRTLEEEQLDDKGLPRAANMTEEENQLNLFGEYVSGDNYRKKISKLDLDRVTPLELFSLIGEWKKEIDDED
ncbi:MAG: DNA mismatch repair protein MutS [Elusimicrobiota bacterium]